MHRFAFLRRIGSWLCLGVVFQLGGCATANQWKEFWRTEIAIVTTQIITDPANESLLDLTGPQVIEEVVPSI